MGRFRIKIKSTWFSEDFIVLRYSTNGIFWKSVKCCKKEMLENRYYMVTKTAHFTDAKYLTQQFDSLEKVKQYEDSERVKCKKYNLEIAEIRKRHKENRRNIYKQYG